MRSLLLVLVLLLCPPTAMAQTIVQCQMAETIWHTHSHPRWGPILGVLQAYGGPVMRTQGEDGAVTVRINGPWMTRSDRVGLGNAIATYTLCHLGPPRDFNGQGTVGMNAVIIEDVAENILEVIRLVDGEWVHEIAPPHPRRMRHLMRAGSTVQDVLACVPRPMEATVFVEATFNSRGRVTNVEIRDPLAFLTNGEARCIKRTIRRIRIDPYTRSSQEWWSDPVVGVDGYRWNNNSI